MSAAFALLHPFRLNTCLHIPQPLPIKDATPYHLISTFRSIPSVPAVNNAEFHSSVRVYLLYVLAYHHVQLGTDSVGLA